MRFNCSCVKGVGYGLDGGGGEAVSEGTCSVSDLGEEVLVE